MAKLSEIYKVGMSANDILKKDNTIKEVTGGGQSAPTSFASGRKLSDYYTVGMDASTVKSIPTVSMPSASTPTSTPTQSIDYNAIIKEYESLPKTDAISRFLNPESREAYKRKQELNPLYEQAKDNRVKEVMAKYGITDDYLSRIAYTPLFQKTNPIDKAAVTLELKKKGVPQNLIQDIFDYAGRQNSAKKNERLTKFADEHEGLGTLAAGALKVQSDIPGLIGNVVDWAQGDPISVSSGQNANTKTVQSMRNAMSDDKTGLSKFAFDVGTSLLDMIPIIATGGAAGLGYAGASAAQSSIPELVDRGLTPNQIMASSVANGIAEAALEKLPLGNLEKWASQPIEKSIKSIAKVIGSQMASEAIEEMGTDVINLITDNLITGDKSQFKQDEKQYGFKTALLNFVKQTVYDGLAGAASGGLLGGMNTARNTVVNGFANPEVPEAKTNGVQANIPTLQNNNVKQVDNSFNLGYNQNANVEKGAMYDGEASNRNDGRGSGPVLNGVLEPVTREQAGSGISSQQGFQSDTARSGGRDTKSLGINDKVFTEDTVDSKSPVSSFDFRYSNNNVQNFYDNFEAAKTSNSNGAAVDSHSVQQLQEIVDNGGNLFMTPDGAVMGAVEGDGNLTAVVKKKDAPYDHAAARVALASLKLGATKGDCYGIKLVDGYSQGGYEPVGYCDYVEGINPAMDAQVKAQKDAGIITENPKVYALKVRDGYTYEKAAENYGKQPRYKDVDTLNASLKYFPGDNGYFDMLNYRDSLINEETSKSKSENKVMAEDIGLKKNKAKALPTLEQTESIEESIENYKPESNRELSQFATNTMPKARMLDSKKKRALFERMKKEGAFDKQTQSDIEVGLKAMDNIDANGLEAEKQRIEEQGTETTAVQLLEAEMIGAEEIKKAIKNNDTSDAIRFFSRLTNRISEVGRALRITQLYQDEATKILVQSNLLNNSSAKEIENKGKKKPKSKEGKILETVDKLTNDITDNVKSDKPKTPKKKSPKLPINRKLAKALSQIENGKQETAARPKKTHEQIRQEVVNTLKQMVPDKRITHEQIDVITNYVETGKVDVDLLAAEMKSFLATDKFFTIDESTPEPQQKGNTKLQSAIDLLTNGRTEKTIKEKNPAQVRREVEATFGADIDSFSEAGVDFLVNLLMDPTISKEVIADELEHYGKTGEFYTIDESTKVNKPKSAKLAKALNYAVENKMQNKTEKAPKSFNTILEEVNNTLDDEGASVNFSDAAKEFLAVMMQEGVSTEVIADEINHYLEHGEFYTLDESTEVSKPTYQRLQNLLNEMGNDTPVQEKVPLTYDEIRERVANTLEKEYAKVDFTDSEISYLARMFADGASSDEIRQALIKKVSSGNFGISAEDMEKIVDLCEQAEKAPTSKESAQFKEQAYAIAAKYAPKASFMDKWNSWRMMSMLLSIPTHTRNIGGNVNWGAITEIKDNIAAVLEEALIKEGQPRTKAVLTSNDSTLVKACEEDFDNTVYEEMAGTSKWNQRTAIERQKRIFKPEWMEKARKFSGNTLEAEDMWALKRKYKKALARYLKANGYNANVFKTDNAILDEARAYAIEQAKDATFHADNALSDMLNDWSRSAREHGSVIGELAIEANFPFKKTPVNVAVQGLRYTPGIGLIPKIAGTNVFQDIFSSQKNVNAFIDVLSRQLTGAAIFGIGAALAAKGWLVTKKDEDEDDPYGKGSNYAIKFGDKSFTIDWAAPAALPLFVGAEVYHALSPNDDPKEDKGFFEALASVGEPIIETSMLQGLDNTLNSLANAGNYKLPTLAANIATGYASQGIPTVLGQIARTVDPYRRSTRTNASSSKNPATAAIQKTAEKTINKIPFLSMTNQKYTDIWGNPQKNSHAIFGDNIAGRAVQNFLLPGYVNDISMTESEKKLATLQKTYEGKGSLIPSLADSNKPDGSRMSNSEYEKFTQVRGTEMQKAVEAALKYDGKSGIKTEDLQDCIHDIENFANFIAQYKQFGRKMSDTYKKAYEAYQLGGYDGVMQYYLMNKSADFDGNGSISQEELAKYLRDSDVPYSERKDYFKIKFPKAKEIPSLR